jgi:hypothetical protein
VPLGRPPQRLGDLVAFKAELAQYARSHDEPEALHEDVEVSALGHPRWPPARRVRVVVARGSGHRGEVVGVGDEAALEDARSEVGQDVLDLGRRVACGWPP